MKKILLTLGLCAGTLTAFGQLPIRVTTITAVSTNNAQVTNTISILNGEAARVAAIQPTYVGGVIDGAVGVSPAHVVKDGALFLVVRGEVIQGPATFYIVSGDSSSLTPNRALLTLERWRVLKSVPVR
jgi:hypothetical protein